MFVLLNVIVVIVPLTMLVTIQYRRQKSFKQSLVWLLRDFSGARFIWAKIFPQTAAKDQDPAPTFLLWLVGIYIALFGIAAQRYETEIDKIENRAHAVLSQSFSADFKKALHRVAAVQNLACSCQPNLFNPVTVLHSLFFSNEIYQETVQLLKERIEDKKEVLNSINLENARLEKAKLWDSNLQEANLQSAKLTGAKLLRANLYKAKIMGADLQEADLSGALLHDSKLTEANLRNAYLQEVKLSKASIDNADLSFANLRKADFSDATIDHSNLHHADLSQAALVETLLVFADLRESKLSDADFSGAVFLKVDLRGAQGLTAEQLCRAKTLRETLLDEELAEQVKQTCPQLLERPDEL
ncbi:MAG: pentapeptide repeat-containing protein [Desulfobacterales bacterium]|nr:MAG: pentapeptide repeat-containing protein [Desulfobacterales bacterium]